MQEHDRYLNQQHLPPVHHLLANHRATEQVSRFDQRLRPSDLRRATITEDDLDLDAEHVDADLDMADVEKEVYSYGDARHVYARDPEFADSDTVDAVQSQLVGDETIDPEVAEVFTEESSRRSGHSRRDEVEEMILREEQGDHLDEERDHLAGDRPILTGRHLGAVPRNRGHKRAWRRI